jgi:hypothetical protein
MKTKGIVEGGWATPINPGRATPINPGIHTTDIYTVNVYMTDLSDTFED